MRHAPGPVLGVLVPCRNEAAIIERKLRNLAACRWPDASDRPHRIVVVDDGSEDDTAALARDLIADMRLPDVQLDVVANSEHPGKAGALAAGLATFGTGVDLVVLTDADVVLRPDALSALGAAFSAEPQLGMACGSQAFVRDLAADGSCLGADGHPAVPAPGRYDRWTAAVRALESRRGKLFSVHGQLLAWRRSLELVPTPGIAADDLELMRQVRARGLRVEKLDDAGFLEVKTPPGPGGRTQALRRARAYVQVIDRCRLPDDAPLIDRLQFAAYRHLPLAAPWMALVGLVATPLLVTLLAGNLAGSIAGLVLFAFVVSPAGRHLAQLLAVIATARRVEAIRPLTDRWEMTREDVSPTRRG